MNYVKQSNDTQAQLKSKIENWKTGLSCCFIFGIKEIWEIEQMIDFPLITIRPRLPDAYQLLTNQPPHCFKYTHLDINWEVKCPSSSN